MIFYVCLQHSIRFFFYSLYLHPLSIYCCILCDEFMVIFKVCVILSLILFSFVLKKTDTLRSSSMAVPLPLPHRLFIVSPLITQLRKTLKMMTDVQVIEEKNFIVRNTFKKAQLTKDEEDH